MSWAVPYTLIAASFICLGVFLATNKWEDGTPWDAVKRLFSWGWVP